MCHHLVPDHAHLYRSIYLRGIPFGGLPTIFCRQLARQVGVCVLFSLSNKMAFSAGSSSLPQPGQIFTVGSISWTINADGVGELLEPMQIDYAPIIPAPVTADPISESLPRSPSSTTRCSLPHYQRRQINNDDLIESIDQIGLKLSDCRRIGSGHFGSAPTTLRSKSIGLAKTTPLYLCSLAPCKILIK